MSPTADPSPATAPGTVIPYEHGAGSISTYWGMVYSPNQDRIYLVPYNQAILSTWHYVDCTTGSIVGYQHGVNATNGAYSGGV